MDTLVEKKKEVELWHARTMICTTVFDNPWQKSEHWRKKNTASDRYGGNNGNEGMRYQEKFAYLILILLNHTKYLSKILLYSF